MEVIKVESLEKSFGELSVLKDISFSVNEGEVLAILGPLGLGQVHAAAMHHPTSRKPRAAPSRSGTKESWTKGVYADKATLRRALLKLGLVFQDFNLFPHFSVLRNITEAQEVVLGRTREESRAKALELLDKMGLADKAASYPLRALRRAEAARPL